MSWTGILAAVFGLALLMVVHESGHHLVARAFKMRVLRFSIGFGPPIWRHQPRGSETVYQVALVPFLAYVQIAGMNPFEDSDPDDAGSYANATLMARILTVFAGPMANYLFASVLFFGALMIGGQRVPTTIVDLVEGGAAEAAHMKNGDEIVGIAGQHIRDFEQMRQIILASPNRPLDIEVLRNKEGSKEAGNKELDSKGPASNKERGETKGLDDREHVHVTVTPEPKGENGGGLIGVAPATTRREAVAVSEALSISVVRPAEVVYHLVIGLGRIVTGKEKASLTGPVGISREIGKAAHRGLDDYLYILALLSAYLGGFNLLPIPALDGGRLMFLMYEGVARRKPNARIEAQIHAIGLLMFLALMVVVSVFDIRGE
jgi:regulator of sigma E protease